MPKKPLIQKRQAEKLVQKHGSPLYVYRKSVVEDRYQTLQRAFTYPHTKIYYACKANTHIGILETLKRRDAGLECTSRGEVEQALKAGFSPNRISYTCSNITQEELHWVMRKGITVHLDSLRQLSWWGAARPNSKVSLRINRNFGAGGNNHLITGGAESKFGIYYTHIPEALRIAKKYNLTVVGMHQHVGSSILTQKTFTHALRLILESAEHLPDLEFIDVGGGFGIPYQPGDTPLDIRKLGKEASEIFSRFCTAYGRRLDLWLEPGRYIVAEAGALLVTVTDIKTTPKHIFCGVNSGLNHLIRPMMYDSYHHIFNLSRPHAEKHKITVVGNVCETDTFADKRSIPLPRVGDILLIADAGAYGYVMSSNYHLRAKPKEILLP